MWRFPHQMSVLLENPTEKKFDLQIMASLGNLLFFIFKKETYINHAEHGLILISLDQLRLTLINPKCLQCTPQ